MQFNDVVEGIQRLSIDEKEEIQGLLQQYIREERRDRLHESFKSAQAEEQQGKLKFSSQIQELKQLIEE